MAHQNHEIVAVPLSLFYADSKKSRSLVRLLCVRRNRSSLTLQMRLGKVKIPSSS